MGKQLSAHFHSDEFRCKGNEKGICNCAGEEIDMDIHLINDLEMVRAHFQKPVIITSGYRCLIYNRYIGSSDDSQHPKKTASDIQVPGVDPSEVYDFLMYHIGGLGRYPTFTHLDERGTKARWDG